MTQYILLHALGLEKAFLLHIPIKFFINKYFSQTDSGTQSMTYAGGLLWKLSFLEMVYFHHEMSNLNSFWPELDVCIVKGDDKKKFVKMSMLEC